MVLPLAALHQERLVRAGEVSQEVKVQSGSKVVRVRHEHVLDALSQELNKNKTGEKKHSNNRRVSARERETKERPNVRSVRARVAEVGKQGKFVRRTRKNRLSKLPSLSSLTSRHSHQRCHLHAKHAQPIATRTRYSPLPLPTPTPRLPRPPALTQSP